MIQRQSLQSLCAAAQNFVLRDRRLHEEDVLVAVCAFIALAVTVMVVLTVCVSAHAAGIYSISIGGGVIALALAYRLLATPEEIVELEAPPFPDFEDSAPSNEGERGSSIVEFAFIYPVVFVTMGGLFGLGQAFYAYNSLQSAVRSAARYASLAPYDLPNGTNWQEEVRNMAVYGDPDPEPNAQPLVPGLTLQHIQASAYLPLGEPTIVTVEVDDFEIDLLFTQFSISQPVVKFPFLGQSLIP